MTTSLDDVFAVLNDIRDSLPDLVKQSRIAAWQVITGEGLSDITKRLGLMQAGEFRVGNGKEPGFGFTGGRYGYPGFSYNGSTWFLAGVENDVLKTGMTITDGKLYAQEATIAGSITASSGAIGGWVLDATRIYKLTANVGIILDSSIPAIKVGDTAGTYIIIDGANQRIRSSNFVSGQSGSNWDTATGNLEVNDIVARGELKTFLLTSSNQMAVAGNILVSKDAGKLGASVSSVATTVDFGKALTPGNWIKIQGPDDTGTAALEWMLIGTLVSGTTYNVTRNVDGSGANGWLKDTPFVVIGANGDSRIELVAGATASLQLITQGATWNTQTIQASMSTVAGAITAGAGTVNINSSGVVINNAAPSFVLKDNAGNLDKIYFNATASNVLEIRNISTSGSIENIIKVGSNNRVVFRLSDTVTRFNNNLDDIDFEVGTLLSTQAIHVDGGAEYVSFFGTSANGIFIVDNGTDKRLEIGQDHYIPTRNASNKTVYFNEAKQDMDFNVKGDNTDYLIFVDASADKVGINTGTPSYTLDVDGDVNVSGAFRFGGTDILTRLSQPGMMQNGKLSVTVSANDLIVALKTYAGNDPSSTDPIKININGTVRTITAACSNTLADATNWMDCGGAELATKVVPFFAYAVWDSGNSIVDVTFARIPWGRLVSDFSSTTTNQFYLANYANYTSTDDLVNIGYFEATLSAGAGYTWTVPTFTNLNLKSQPTLDSNSMTWVPQHTRSTTTYTGFPTVNNANYIIKGRLLTIAESHTQHATPGGSGYQQFTLPFANSLANAQEGSTANNNTAVMLSTHWFTSSKSVSLFKYDGAVEATASQKYMSSGNFILSA